MWQQVMLASFDIVYSMVGPDTSRLLQLLVALILCTLWQVLPAEANW